MSKNSIQKYSNKIMVIGAGTWGTAIANHLAINNNLVFLNTIEPDVIKEINSKNTNSKYLPNIKLSKNLSAINDFKTDVNQVYIVVPSEAIGVVFNNIKKSNFNKNCIFVICSKGFEKDSLSLISDAFINIVNHKNFAVLSGPNFAIEVANQVPTITTIASSNKILANKVIKTLNSVKFLAIYFDDVRTAEICGIVKNILAIGCGLVDGLNLGVNTKSALLIKGINEIQMICKKISASTDLANPAGFGDIFLTCSSEKSRNNTLGRMIATGKNPLKIKDKSSKPKTTFEGASSAKIIVKFAKKLKLKLALCETISNIIDHDFSPAEIQNQLVKVILNNDAK
jgi:glycerol-3-phosphate dehydrogenase (NAD(P)+)